jgi:UDP-N-acetylglucosamine transferase subunit ALG13
VRLHAEKLNSVDGRRVEPQRDVVEEASRGAAVKPSRPTGHRIHLATSSGGHIALLIALRDAFRDYDRAWITQESPHAERLKANGEIVELLPRYDRHLIRGRLLQNCARAFWIVARDRPRLVITPGSGLIVPFCLLARLAGARLIFVETMARVTTPSAAGRVLSRVAHEVFVQWPEALPLYPNAQLCRPALLEEVSPRQRSGTGTFVGVGLAGQPFDRLLQVVDRAAESGVLPQPIIAQVGTATYKPKNFEATRWLEPDAVEAHIRDSEVIICHTGSGLISASLKTGRRPLAMARSASHGEHFDDHQRQLLSKLGEIGLVVPIEDEITEACVQHARAPLADAVDATGPAIVDALRAALARNSRAWDPRPGSYAFRTASAWLRRRIDPWRRPPRRAHGKPRDGETR